MLIKLFLRLGGRGNGEKSEREILGSACGAVGIAVNLILCFFKLLAGALSGSVAVLTDGFNNLTDASSSLVTLFGFRLASKRPDRHHPFGHGRVEYLTGLAISLLVCLLGIELAGSAWEQLISPAPVRPELLAVLILIVSVPVKLLLFRMNRRIGKQIGSSALLATATDCIADAAAGTMTLLCLMLGNLTTLPLDGLCGLFLAALILISGIRSAFDTMNPLLGQAPDPATVSHIQQIVSEYPDLLGMHDLIIHDYGPGRLMVSLHAEVDSACDLIAAHDTVDNLENRLMEELGCHAVIHMDPILVGDPRTDEMKEALREMTAAIDPTLSVHDIRLVEGTTHTNLIFDLAIGDSKREQREIEGELIARIAARYPDYRAVMRIERYFIEEETRKENKR